MHEEDRNAYRVLVWKPEVNRPLGRRKCRWKDNIKISLIIRLCGHGLHSSGSG
jgi:hypothetical protein